MIVRPQRSILLRALGVGSTESSEISGDSPWGTPLGVWMRKVGLADEREASPAMAMGKALEVPILRALADHLEVRLVHNARRFPHPEWPAVPMYATPDGFGPGRRSLAEVKLVAHRLDDWRDGPPPYVRLQCLHHLAVFPRAEVVHVGALLGGELRTWDVERDQAAITDLEEAVGRWWATYVVPEVSPPPTGPDDAWALLRARVSPDRRETRPATEEETVAAAHLAVLQAEIDGLTAQAQLVRLELAGAAQEADLEGRGWTGRWSTRTLTDWAGIVHDLGVDQAVLAAHRRTSPVFTVRRKAEEESAA